MIGREAYHHPLVAGTLGRAVLRRARRPACGAKQSRKMVAYMEREHAQGTPWHSIARHMMGLYNGLPGARRWRQVWSDHRLKGEPAREVMRLAHETGPEPGGRRRGVGATSLRGGGARASRDPERCA